MDEESLKIYTRLMVQCSISDAIIKNNPLPYLRRASERIAVLQTALENALHTLDGTSETISYTFHNNDISEFEDIRATINRRNQRAVRILRGALITPPQRTP